MAEILNANPTIRNASDLPTRRGRTLPLSDRKKTLGLFASSIPSLTYLSDPFEPVLASSDSESDDDNAVEPIDEQEIYGKSTASVGPHMMWWHLSQLLVRSPD